MKKKDKIEIGVIGMSHKTAPVEIREKFSLDDNKLPEFLEKANSKGIDEIVCVSTCNRVEIYFTTNDIESAFENLTSALEEFSLFPKNKLKNIIYKKHYKEAVMHLLNVASSLDSMVLGENEILGQVKDAYRKSAFKNKTGAVLNKLFHQAFKTAKLVRAETGIARSPLSIAFIAVELAKSIFKDLTKKSALLIGVGEMGELILKYLIKYNLTNITIANRSYHNAQKITEDLNARAEIIALDDIKSAIPKADIIISSASASDYIISKETIKHSLKQKNNSPTFIIDIAVPRSVDPAVSETENIFLYNIDSLKEMADKNLQNRINEVEAAKKLIESDADKFFEWYESLDIVSVISNIQNQLDSIREKELEKYKKKQLKHLSKKDLALIENLTNQIMTKTLHNPIMYLKAFQRCPNADNEKIKESIRIIEELFGKHS
jgi:glutamyl-tRNA reductase